jgi:hypothetical protein
MAKDKKAVLTTEIIDAYGKRYALRHGELVRLEVDNTHYYFLNEQFLIGVTTILGEAAPVPQGLRLFWQNNTREDSEAIFNEAAIKGSNVHNGIQKLLSGEALNLLQDYTDKEKRGLVAFVDWFRTYLPQDFESEQPIASLQYQYAGTLDFVCMINGERWLVDFKTSNAIHFSHQLQVLAYKQAYEESYGKKIDRCFVLRVGTIHKGNGNKEVTEKVGGWKPTGPGWEFKEVTEYSFENFLHVYNTYKALHGGVVPQPEKIEAYPAMLQLYSVV